MKLDLKPLLPLIAIIILSVPLFCTGLWAHEHGVSGIKSILVIGTASTASTDAAKARDLAISNGLISAVSQAADELLAEGGLAKYFHEISQTVLNDTSPYILSYQVPAESSAEHVYRVIVKATVSLDALRRHLQNAGFIRSRNKLPKILFLISETSAEDPSPRFWWGGQTVADSCYSEQAIKELMVNASHEIVSPKGISFSGDYSETSLLTDQDALEIGRHSIADVLVVGDAKVEMAPNVLGSDKRTFKGVVTIRALRSDTGELIVRIEEEAVILDTDPIEGSHEALNQAGILAGKTLSTQLAAKWHTTSGSADQLTLTVEGISDLLSFVKFRKSLRAIPGVNSIFISEMQTDEAGIQVDYTGSADALAEALMLITFDSFGINIYEVASDQLKIKLVKE